MNELDRIKLAITYLINRGIAGTRKEVGHLLGYTNESSFSQIINGKVPLPKNFIIKLSSLDTHISKKWLLTGEGEMLKSGTASDDHGPLPDAPAAAQGKVVPLYDAEVAAGGYYASDMTPTRPASMINVGSMLKDSESAICVYGNSMVPNYPAGCVIGTKEHVDSFIEPGRVYVIETRGGRYIKRLYYNDDKTCFLCVSDNHMLFDEGPRKGKPCYPEFEVPFNEVVRLHKVVGVIKRNIL